MWRGRRGDKNAAWSLVAGSPSAGVVPLAERRLGSILVNIQTISSRAKAQVVAAANFAPKGAAHKKAEESGTNKGGGSEGGVKAEIGAVEEGGKSQSLTRPSTVTPSAALV
jgi:hypothetical protein